MPALPEGLRLPELITACGDKATWRFVAFFTADNENDNTRSAYYRPSASSMPGASSAAWACINSQPFVVVAYATELKWTRHPQTVKQLLAPLRMLFDNLKIGQVILNNPVASVRGPKYSTKKCKSPVLTAEETGKLFEAIDTNHLIGLRDRALNGVMV